MTAYAYLRKSVSRDPTREVSHEVQESTVRQLAARFGDDNGALVLLSDWDKSGRLGADKRPGYRALLEAIESGAATSIYSYSLSRLGRSLAELARLIGDCAKRGVPVRLVADNVDTSTASGMLTANVLSSVAQFEADIASERTRASNVAKLARGQTLRTVRYYGEGPGEDAAAVLTAFRDAGSYSGAAKLLNERGVKPRQSGRGWWPSSVNVVIARIAPELAGRRRERGVRAGGTDYILARLLTCPTCGTRLTGTRDRDGRRVRYSCRLGTALPHPRISVTESRILPAIRTEVDHLETPGDRAETHGADERERAKLEARRVRILDMFESGNIDRAERERRLAVVHEALERLDDHVDVVEFPAVDVTWSAPPRVVNGFLRSLFRSITLDPETFQPVAFAWAVPEWRRA